MEADDNESSFASSSASEMSARHGPRYMASGPEAAGSARAAPGVVPTRPHEAALANSPSARQHHCAAHLPEHSHLRLVTFSLASLPTPWPTCRLPASSPRPHAHHGTWRDEGRVFNSRLTRPRRQSVSGTFLQRGTLMAEAGGRAGWTPVFHTMFLTSPPSDDTTSLATPHVSSRLGQPPCCQGWTPGYNEARVS